MKKIAIVDLKGGLGNQLFILSIAKKLEDLGFKIFIDISIYSQKHDFPRNIEVDLNIFFKNIISLKVDKIFHILNRTVFELNNIKDLPNKNFLRFKGYYADVNFLDETYLKNILAIPNKKIPNSLMVHIRKGDYQKLNIELTSKYYNLALNKIKSKLNIKLIDVYTDDFDFKLRNYGIENQNINNIYTPNHLSAIDTLKEMTRYQNFIIANSTFSFFAAYLGQTQSSTILYPKPWTIDNIFEIKNLPNNWQPIKNLT